MGNDIINLKKKCIILRYLRLRGSVSDLHQDHLMLMKTRIGSMMILKAYEHKSKITFRFFCHVISMWFLILASTLIPGNVEI